MFSPNLNLIQSIFAHHHLTTNQTILLFSLLGFVMICLIIYLQQLFKHEPQLIAQSNQVKIAPSLYLLTISLFILGIAVIAVTFN